MQGLLHKDQAANRELAVLQKEEAGNREQNSCMIEVTLADSHGTSAALCQGKGGGGGGVGGGAGGMTREKML